MQSKPAPELQTSEWLNTDRPCTLRDLLGRVVLIEAFQMLCPGCVSHALPQAGRVARTFRQDEVTVIGLHTVFEHHAAQGSREALEAFLHEYRIFFPVGIDAPSQGGGIPQTMAAYGMQGTPTQILIDRQGRCRKQQFGAVQDMELGAEIMALLREEPAQAPAENQAPGRPADDCDDQGCPANQ